MENEIVGRKTNGRRLEITIADFKMPSWNKYYAGQHWSVRAAQADQIHALVVTAAKKLKTKIVFNKCTIVYTAYFKHKTRRDLDNLCVKFFTDGLVKAGLIKDDHCGILKCIGLRGFVGCKENKVILEIFGEVLNEKGR